MNSKKTAIIITFSTLILSIGVNLIYTPILLNKLGASEHGIFSLVNTIVSYFVILDFGFGTAIVRFSMKYINEKNNKMESKLLGMFFVVYSIMALIILLSGVILVFSIESIFGKSMTINELSMMRNLTILGIINIALSFIFKVFNSSIQAHQKFLIFKVLGFFRQVINPLIFIGLLFFGQKATGIIVATLLLTTIYSLCEYIYFKVKLNIKLDFKFKELKIFKAVVVFSFFIFLNIIVDKVNWSVSSVLLGVYIGAGAVSIYAIAAQINTMFISFSTAVTGIFLPEVSLMEERGESSESFSNLFIKVSRIQIYLIGLLLTGIIMFGKEFILLWVGEFYIESYWILVILTASVAIPLTQNIGISILQAKHLHKFRSIAYIAMLILNILISIFLIKQFGVSGAGIGTGIAFIIGNVVIMNIYYYKKISLDIKGYWKNLIKILLSFIPAIIIVAILKHYIVINNWFILGGFIIIYTILYLIGIWLLSFNKYEKGIVTNAINAVKNIIVKTK